MDTAKRQGDKSEMGEVQEILQAAEHSGQRVLSEFESKRLVEAYGIPVVQEFLAQNLAEVREAASKIGYPVVLKFCSAELAHKTEKGLIEVGLNNEADLTGAFESLQKEASGLNGDFLVQKMVKGARELVMGMIRDPQFGPCVMFGLGGIFTEVLCDVSFRMAPLNKKDALGMMREIKGHKILEAVRGMEAADLDALAQALVGLGQLGLEQEVIKEIDINPLIIEGSQPKAVDALIVLR